MTQTNAPTPRTPTARAADTVPLTGRLELIDDHARTIRTFEMEAAADEYLHATVDVGAVRISISVAPPGDFTMLAELVERGKAAGATLFDYAVKFNDALLRGELDTRPDARGEQDG